MADFLAELKESGLLEAATLAQKERIANGLRRLCSEYDCNWGEILNKEMALFFRACLYCWSVGEELDSEAFCPRCAEQRRRFAEAHRSNTPQVMEPAKGDSQELELTGYETMLAERVKEWTRLWREEGLQQGLEQGRQEGREEGLAAIRRLLRRQVERRFGPAAAESAEPLLAQLTRPEAFERIAEWVIDARDAEDFLSRLRTPAP